MHSIELFAGAGGLALGVAEAGFAHHIIIEHDKDTCLTLNANKSAVLSQ
ncbi:DNA cytosine methyltransferase [Candidatus Gracilibacteria bacterium]|nr:DNA cytosine methyltransferase [Candidatus Gracilibacteria bacterium]